MSESIITLAPPSVAGAAAPLSRRRSLGVRAALVWEVVTGGLIELWAHKLRSLLTLTLLMLGVFALVVMTSVLDGVKDPVGRDVVIEGSPYRIVGVLASGQIFNEELYMDANGVLIPLATYMDRMDKDHQLAQVTVKLKSKRDLDEVSAAMLARA